MTLLFRTVAAAAIFMLALLAIDLAIARPPTSFWSERVSDGSCAVYRAFHEALPSKEAAFLRSATVPWTPFLILPPEFEKPLEPGTAPFAARRFTRKESKAKGEQFEIDTSAYFASLTGPEPLFLRDCFATTLGPSFFDGPLVLFFPHAAALSLVNDYRTRDANLWRLSPVGFSSDGRYALLYATNECPGMCGGAVYFLFERSGSAWSLAGTSVDWIS